MELWRDFVMETSKFDDLFEPILMKNTKTFDVLGNSPAAMVWMTLQSKLQNSGLYVLDGFCEEFILQIRRNIKFIRISFCRGFDVVTRFQVNFCNSISIKIEKCFVGIIEFLPWQLHIYAVFNSVSWINWDFILWKACESNWQQTKNFQLITL